MKNGWQTSEFWLTVLGLAVGAWLLNQGHDVKDVLALTAGVGAYAVSRGLAKKS